MPKRCKSFPILLFLFIFLRVFLSHAEVVDKILVVVNDEIVTQGDVDRVLVPVYAQYKNLYDGQELIEKIDEVRENVLKRLVEDKLLLTEAKKKEITVEEEELKQRVDDVRKRFSTEEKFKQALDSEGVSLSKLEKNFKDRIMMEKFVNSEVNTKISVSPNELWSYYEANRDDFKEPKMVKVRSILIKIEENRPEKEALKSAQKILYRLQEGSDFALLAKEYSDGPYADSGGDMGWVRDGQLMERINGLIFEMNEGDISSILKTKLGFHIFKVEEKRDTETKTFAEAKKHIEKLLYSTKREERLRNLLEKLKENAYIAFR